MRGRLAASVLILLLAAVPAVASATRAHAAAGRLSVRPGSGVSTTRFFVSFRAPDRSGHSGIVQHTYRVTVAGPSGRGCLSSMRLSPRASRKNVVVKVALDPARSGKPWCVGTFHGRVQEISGPWCPPPPQRRACPAFATRIRTLGKFSFRVRKSARDTTPPSFAGLVSAVSCSGGPQNSGSVVSFSLNWKAAIDDQTPRAGVVYEVFVATASKRENFAKPNWKTAPGATGFATPRLAANHSYYFVVRARDLAGNVDRNRVERLGQVFPCV